MVPNLQNLNFFRLNSQLKKVELATQIKVTNDYHQVDVTCI